MSESILVKSGGGADLDVITATAADIVAPKVSVDKDGEPITGTMVDRGNWNSSDLAAGASVTIPAGKHGGSGKVTAKSLSSQTSATSAANHILSGYTAWVNGSKITGTIPSQSGKTITPSTSNQTAISAGTYASGAITVAGNSNLVAGNIRKGVTIFGVTGTLQQYTTSPSTILNGTTWASGLSSGFTANGSAYITGSSSSGKYNINNLSDEYLRSNSAVNLTDYKYLKAVVSSSTYYEEWFQLYLCVSTSASFTGYTATSAKSANTTSKNTIISDVTNLSGMYYIYFHCVSPGGGYAGGSIYSITLSNS